MPVELEELSVDALRDLGRMREVEGHNDMDRADLLSALDGPVDDDLAQYLGRTRQDLYSVAKERGIEGLMDMKKREILEALADGSA